MHSSITRMMTCARKARLSGKALYNNQAMGVLAQRGESPLESPSPSKRMSTRVDDKAKENFGQRIVLFNNLPLEVDPEREKFLRSTRPVIESQGFDKLECYSIYSLFQPTDVDNEFGLKVVADIAELGIKEYNKTNNTDFEYIRIKHSNHALEYLEYYKARTMHYYITFIAKERGNQKEITFQAKGYGGGDSRYKPTLEFVRLKKSEHEK